MTKLLLIRHGQTDWNADGRWQGWAPVPLNETGRQQARVAAAFIQNTYQLAAVYCSDLPRALETARIIAEQNGVSLTPDPRLRGPNIGAWQGLTGEEIQRWDKPRWEQYAAGRPHINRPDGESNHEVTTRFMPVVGEARLSNPGKTFGVVTHSGALWAVLNHLAVTIPEGTEMHNSSITELEWHLDGWQLVSIAQIPAE